MLSHIQKDKTYLDRPCFSDEATFHVFGIVNRYNCYIWGSENLHDINEHGQDSLKVVWCALMKNEPISSFFGENPVVTNDTFLAMGCLSVGTVFHLDGAPNHFSHHVHAFLDRELPVHWIGRGGSFPWLQSQDLTPMDFFFWEFVKDTVYCEKMQNMNEQCDNHQSCRVSYQ
jgi:hypothetical protein